MRIDTMEFIKKINSSSQFYRASRDISGINGYWFAFSPDDIRGYGNILGTFTPSRELNLIDITSGSFYIDYINRFNNHFHSNPTGIPRLTPYLFPIGFTDKECYQQFFSTIQPTHVIQPIQYDILSSAQFFGNRSRCSVKDLDMAFMETIYLLYPMVDGIIASTKLPNFIFNGYHHSEICVKDPMLMILSNTVQMPVIGGGEHNSVIAIDIKHPIIDEALNFIKHHRKQFEEVNSTKKARKTRKMRKNL